LHENSSARRVSFYLPTAKKNQRIPQSRCINRAIEDWRMVARQNRPNAPTRTGLTSPAPIL
jgi:hypothetical protein